MEMAFRMVNQSRLPFIIIEAWYYMVYIWYLAITSFNPAVNLNDIPLVGFCKSLPGPYPVLSSRILCTN